MPDWICKLIDPWLFQMKQVETSIASKLVVNPVKLRFDVRSELPHEILYVETVAIDEDLLPLPTIPWWVIVLAIVIGILLLSLLIWILYKVSWIRGLRSLVSIARNEDSK